MTGSPTRTASPALTLAAPVRNTRLAGVDGLRAFAALWVLAFHILAVSGAQLPGVDVVIRSGSTGVSLFLVLSGFCLYAPFAGGRLDRFRTAGFLRRRCRRLLPAYYASLVVVFVAHVVANGRLDLLAMTGPEAVAQAVTHMTLTHQLFPDTFYGLNGAYWSLGLEWELYLTLPLLVLAVRRFGLARTLAIVTAVCAGYRLALAAATAAGALPAESLWATVVVPNTFLGRWSEFAMGMLAAELYRRGLVRLWLWPAVPVAVVSALVALAAPDNPLKHVLFGVVFFTLLCVVLAGENPIARAFSWRPLVAIGMMSYSVYLVHQPMLQIAAAALRNGFADTPTEVFVGLVLLVPSVLAVARLLFVTVERPTMSPPSVGAARARRLAVRSRRESGSSRRQTGDSGAAPREIADTPA